MSVYSIIFLALALPLAAAQYRCDLTNCASGDKCCHINQEEGQCYNATTQKCVECESDDFKVCLLGQECCGGYCFFPTELRCCSPPFLAAFLCTLNETCCGASTCCPSDMTCDANGDCTGYPAAPTCSQPCKEDSDCVAGGSQCTACMAPLEYPTASKVCVATIAVPTTTSSAQAFDIIEGEAIYFHYSTASADVVSVLNLQFQPQVNPSSCLGDFQVGVLNEFSGQIFTNLNGTNLVVGDSTLSVTFSDTHTCYGSDGSGTYSASATPFPTSNLWLSADALWQGVVTGGEMLTFPLNNNHTIDATQQPFVVNVTVVSEGNSNCSLVQALGYSSANGVHVLALPGVSVGAFYGAAFSGSWMGQVYVLNGSCEVSVQASYVPMLDFGTRVEFDLNDEAFVYCGGYVGVCPGKTYFGNFTRPQGSTSSTYCLTVSTVDYGCSFSINGGGFSLSEEVTLPYGSTARIDAVTDHLPCSGYIMTEDGACSSQVAQRSSGVAIV